MSEKVLLESGFPSMCGWYDWKKCYTLSDGKNGIIINLKSVAVVTNSRGSTLANLEKPARRREHDFIKVDHLDPNLPL